MNIANRPLLFLLLLSLCGCADDTFFQADALVKGNAAPATAGITAGDSVWAVAGRHYSRSGFHRFFWGDHHRALWAAPVRVPVLDINKAYGGLQPHKMGGGFQTTSLQLKDAAGRLYALRSLDKDPVLVLPAFWQTTFAANVLRDQTSAANPYGPLVVPVLARALGVHHASPRLFYVSGTNTSFGEHNARMQGKLFFLEEKYKDEDDLTPDFGAAEDFVNSNKAFRLRYTYNNYHFDAKAFLKARLLDLLIGDWDRHKGQWDWAVVRQGNEVYFEPVPKDRDQAFIRMNDGLIPAIATSKFVVRKLHSFGDSFTDVKALLLNATYLDHNLLNELSKEDFKDIARQAQAALTDEVVKQAVRQLPGSIYSLQGAELSQNLKRRRDQLPEAALEMYLILADEVTIAATDASEQFVVTRLNNNETALKVTRPASKTTQERVLYERIFYHTETKKLILHGLGGDDTFLVQGAVGTGIPVHIYGGVGEDIIADSSSVKSWGKHTIIYDTRRGNEIFTGTEAKDRTTPDVRIHAFDREGNK